MKYLLFILVFLSNISLAVDLGGVELGQDINTVLPSLEKQFPGIAFEPIYEGSNTTDPSLPKRVITYEGKSEDPEKVGTYVIEPFYGKIDPSDPSDPILLIGYHVDSRTEVKGRNGSRDRIAVLADERTGRVWYIGRTVSLGGDGLIGMDAFWQTLSEKYGTPSFIANESDGIQYVIWGFDRGGKQQFFANDGVSPGQRQQRQYVICQPVTYKHSVSLPKLFDWGREVPRNLDVQSDRIMLAPDCGYTVFATTDVRGYDTRTSNTVEAYYVEMVAEGDRYDSLDRVRRVEEAKNINNKPKL